MSIENQTDCTVVGASFAGLACASALAQAGLRVTVMEKKADAGEKLHTTGIIVKDAIDQVAFWTGSRRNWFAGSVPYGCTPPTCATSILPRPAIIFSPPTRRN